MLLTVEKRDDINITLRGTIPHNVIQEKISELRAQAGKENAADDSTFQREAEGQILHDFIERGMKEAKVTQDEMLGQPSFKTYEEQENGLFLEVEISTRPEIDTSVAYMDIVPSYTKPTIDPKAVDAKLEEMAVQHAPFEKIKEERAVQNGDLVVIDFEGFLNGRALEGGSAEKYNLKVGSKTFIPGFEEQMIGWRTNEEKTVKITFPQDYQSKALAGQETEFKVKLHEIREQKRIELNDALAQRILGNENATLDTLKAKMAEKILTQEFSNLYNETLKPQIIRGLLTKFDFTLPNNVVEQEIDAKINERAQRMSQEEHARYKEDKEKFNELRDTLRGEARDSVKAALIVDALAKKEGVDVSDQEVLSALEIQAMMTGQDPEELLEYYKTNNLMTAAKVGLIENKLFQQWLEAKNRH
ncbi:MAG TPA: trigger factor [Sulfurovum sp.]|uniref:trigger factor n=1 Tax=Sulfurovum sp. TaxID=1969726 RepID=UPI002F943F60